MEDRPSFEKLSGDYMELIRRLRRECPWDRDQTHESLRSPLLEEAYEAAEAITDRNLEHLRNELGDIMLHITLQAVIAEEERAFTMSDILTHSMQKLIRRHPHVFGDVVVDGQEQVKKNWETIKREEGKKSLGDGIPNDLPALIRAQRIQERASVVGFDWRLKTDVWKKVTEEIEELANAEQSGNPQTIEHEFGDLLFALVNYSRFIGVSAEFALRKSIDKFNRRFRFIEEQLAVRGKVPAESTLEEMDLLWNEAKKVLG